MSNEKPLSKWTRKELLAVPTVIDLGLGIADPIEVDGVVIIPTARKHDSGYTIMDLVFAQEGKPMVRANGTCDVFSTEMPVNVDCLPVSRCLYVWTRRTFLVDWPTGSSVTFKEVQP